MKLLILGFLLQVFVYRTRGKVVDSFKNICPDFFISDPSDQNVHYPPTVLHDSQSSNRYQQICQRWQDSYRYATLYDTKGRIPVYSAYYYVGYHKVSKADWKIEPQLDDPSLGPDMAREETVVTNDKGKNQALYDDYASPRAEGYTRGHLFPRCHNNDQDCAIATYTHTNAVPQTQNVNNEWATKVEKKMEKLIQKTCDKGFAHVVTGAVPGQSWLEIKRNNVLVKEGVNVPDHFWTACCCQSKTTLWSAAWLAQRKNKDLEVHQDEDQEKRKDDDLYVYKKTVQQLEEELTRLYGNPEGGFRIFGGLCQEIRRYSRNTLTELRRPSSAIGRLMSQQSLLDFSFDHSEENPLEVLEDVFATFENKKKSRSGRQKQIIPKNLMDSRCLKLIVDLNLHSDTRSLLHLHKKKKPPSIGSQYQASLVKLLDTLRRADPFFVRCIRSNAEKREMQFDDELVLRQLRYSGMLETVLVKRSGYGAKYTFEEFRDEFRILLPRQSSSLQQDIEKLLLRTTADKNNFQIGKTKVFLKEEERLNLQDSLHREAMRRILLLQRWFRACLTRKHFLIKKRAIIIVQRSWRSYRVSTQYRAASVIQKAWRHSHERAEYVRQRESLKKLQQLKRSSENRRRQPEEQVSRAESVKGTAGSNDIRKGMLMPRPDGKIKPLPPVPPQTSGEDEQVQNRGGVPERSERRGDEETDRRARASAAPPRPDPLTDPKPDDGLGMLTLQRSKPANMKEKVEKWRERRSEIMVPDRENLENLENRRMKDLKTRGISMSLDNLSKLSSSDSDGTSPSHPE
ncbi:unconventional myosin-IXb-like isoform X2, partial [Clarias magur]